MDKWIELQRFYEEWKLSKSKGGFDDFGFDFANGKRHLFMFLTNEYSDIWEWYIEVNDVVDGAHEPIDVTFAPADDEACLMVQICWCIERFS